jgi:hypothetical protein
VKNYKLKRKMMNIQGFLLGVFIMLLLSPYHLMQAMQDSEAANQTSAPLSHVSWAQAQEDPHALPANPHNPARHTHRTAVQTKHDKAVQTPTKFDLLQELIAQWHTASQHIDIELMKKNHWVVCDQVHVLDPAQFCTYDIENVAGKDLMQQLVLQFALHRVDEKIVQDATPGWMKAYIRDHVALLRVLQQLAGIIVQIRIRNQVRKKIEQKTQQLLEHELGSRGDIEANYHSELKELESRRNQAKAKIIAPCKERMYILIPPIYRTGPLMYMTCGGDGRTQAQKEKDRMEQYFKWCAACAHPTLQEQNHRVDLESEEICTRLLVARAQKIEQTKIWQSRTHRKK